MRLVNDDAFSLGAAVLGALATHDRAQIDRRVEAAAVMNDPILAAMKPLLYQPEAALAKLHTILANPPASAKFTVPQWLAYFGDAEGALESLRSSSNQRLVPPTLTLLFSWRPVMKDVRALPGFKQLMRDLGVVDQWREFGWPDLCKPVGETDFECS